MNNNHIHNFCFRSVQRCFRRLLYLGRYNCINFFFVLIKHQLYMYVFISELITQIIYSTLHEGLYMYSPIHEKLYMYSTVTFKSDCTCTVSFTRDCTCTVPFTRDCACTVSFTRDCTCTVSFTTDCSCTVHVQSPSRAPKWCVVFTTVR